MSTENMTEKYPSNSIKDSIEKPERKLERVTTGSAKPKKKGEMQKFKDVFISEDVNNIKSYVLMDVLVPAIKKAISDIVTNGIDMILYGETGRDRKTTSGAKVSYSNFYEGKRDTRSSYKQQSGFDYDDIVFERRGDAEAVLTAMEDSIDRYGFVSVLDIYDLAEVSTSNYTLGNYGWKDLRGAKTVPVRNGYILKLPKAIPLK